MLLPSRWTSPLLLLGSGDNLDPFVGLRDAQSGCLYCRAASHAYPRRRGCNIYHLAS
jgi:hypothetical protein